MTQSMLTRRGLITGALSFAALLGLPAGSAYAETGDVFEQRHHGTWWSGLMRSRTNEISGRAGAWSEDRRTHISIDWHDTENFSVLLVENVHAFNRELGRYDVALRTDRGTVFRTTGTARIVDRMLHLSLGEELSGRFVEELRTGSVLRVQINTGVRNHYTRFRLDGSALALDRSRDLISRYRPALPKQPDDEFFRDEPAPRRRPRANTDADFF
ncbi:hypothetical protein [Sutterella sp.]|uniref:hypothetical protein n=1 Tax=Sutterella sp. TaxID=1981025 RepID=UPI0026DF1594|nr:hypothetical protein [Sutterella sp.]MDO5531628.1 hypothetical protein [Sutterella sp.]